VRWLSRAAADLLAEAEAIAPIPLHRWRFKLETGRCTTVRGQSPLGFTAH